jgi:hypothetical protein
VIEVACQLTGTSWCVAASCHPIHAMPKPPSSTSAAQTAENSSSRLRLRTIAWLIWRKAA